MLDSCLVEAVSNTAFYVSGAGAKLHLVLCVLDGLESCQRAVHLASQSSTLAIDFCYVTDMFSLITSSNQETQNNVAVRVSGSCFSDLQECIRVCLPKSEGVNARLSSSQASMVLYDAECGTSSTMEVAGLTGTVEMLNCNISFSHCDGRAFVSRWGGLEDGQVRVSRCQILATGEVDRKLSVGEAVAVLSEASQQPRPDTERDDDKDETIQVMEQDAEESVEPMDTRVDQPTAQSS